MFYVTAGRTKQTAGFPCAAATSKGTAGRMMMKKMGMLFVLWLIKKKPMKAYDAMKLVREDGMPFATANRIYPLFSFMEKEGLVRGKRIAGDRRGGKEYFITVKGEGLLRACKKRFCGGLMGEYIRDMVK
ncbi:MAG: PadR family transcriptional regulator [Candidatus Micrarchaeota archaeon]|nr:PadR family transcriptional regulator [Candidatus Micrarchaeota archaeon]